MDGTMVNISKASVLALLFIGPEISPINGPDARVLYKLSSGATVTTHSYYLALLNVLLTAEHMATIEAALRDQALTVAEITFLQLYRRKLFCEVLNYRAWYRSKCHLRTQ